MLNNRVKLLTFIIILIVCMLFISCNGDDTDKTNGGTNDGSENIQNGINADPNLRENTPDSLPGGLNFNGTEIRVLQRDYFGGTDPWGQEIDVESETGDIVYDAVYRRTRSVEERLNVKISTIKTPGGWGERDQFMGRVRNSVKAGTDDYDVIAGFYYYIVTLAPEGILYNLNKVPYLNPDAIWWSADMAEQMTIDGKSYFISGDLSLTFLMKIFVTYFNKKMAEDMNLENLYQTVLNGNFTIDKMNELTKGVYRDLNGNGKPDYDDKYGFATTAGGTLVDQYYSAFDQPIVKKDMDGIPQLALNTPKMVGIVEKLHKFFYENQNTCVIKVDVPGCEDIIVNMFVEDRTLFMPGFLATSEYLRNMNSDYGIIPVPKWDKAQPGYYTTSANSMTMFCIPETCNRIEATGAVMEALGAETYRKVTPVYYETTLKKKYSRDDETSQMLDLIREGVRFDFGMANTMCLENIANIIRELTFDQKTDFVSRYEKYEPTWQKALDKLVEAYQDLP